MYLQGVFKFALATTTKSLSEAVLASAFFCPLCYAQQPCAEVNQRVKLALASHPTLTNMYKGLLKKGVNRSNERVTKVMPGSGAILYSAQEVLIGCLAGYAFTFFSPQWQQVQVTEPLVAS